MGRYTGPVCRLCRREGEKLSLKGKRCMDPNKCSMDRKRRYPPGEHGRGRTKETEYLIQLREKQKVKRMYCVSEKQFRRYYEVAAKRKGVTGEHLLMLLESRLDNVVYRSSFAVSRRDARQLVSHGHIIVNDKKTDIPSYILKDGDVVKVKKKNEETPMRVLNAMELSPSVPNWITVDRSEMKAVFDRPPERSELQEIDIPIRERLIVELYSK